MSEKKMFTAEEVARMLLEKAHNTLKKHEEILKKSKNSAHEIDAGEEPKNDEAECPDSLKGEGSSSASKSESNKSKSPVAESEDSEMEDEPLSDDDSDEDEEESEEDESEEDEYEFKKSESGMHVIQYKTLKKARVDEGKSDYEKRTAREHRQGTEKGVHRGQGGESWAGEKSTDAAAHKKILEERKKKIANPDDSEKKYQKDLEIRSKKSRQQAIAEHKKVSDEAKNIKPNLPKSEDCEYEVKKSESGMYVVEYKTLKKADLSGIAGPRQPNWISDKIAAMQSKQSKPAAAPATPPSAPPQKPAFGLSKEEDPEMIPNPDPKAPTHIKRRGEKKGKSRPLTDAQRRAHWGQAISNKRKTTNIGQYEGTKVARDKKEQKESKKSEALDKSYEEKIKEGKGTEVFHSKKGKARTISQEERNAVTAKPGTSSLKGQTDNQRRVREEKNEARKKHAETGQLDSRYGETAKNRREKEGTVHMRKKPAREFRKKNLPYEQERKAPRKRSTDE